MIKLNRFSQNQQLIFSIFFISFIICVRDIIGIAVPGIFLLLCCCGIMLVLKFKELIPFLFFLFPLTNGIPGYIMFAGYIFLILKGNGATRSQIFPVIIIAILELLDEGLTDNIEVISGIISFLSFCGIFFYFLNDKRNYNYILTSILFFGVGIAFTFLIIFYNMFQQYDINFILSGMARSGALGVVDNNATELEGHLGMNANTIAYYAICGASSLTVLLKSYNKIISVPLILFIIVGGLLTVSRTYILCLSLFYFLYFFFSPGKKKLYFIFLLVLIFITSLYFIGDYFDILKEAFINRAENNNIETAGGRTILFAAYNSVWFSSLWYIFFGVGVVNYFPVLGIFNAMHSGLQQIWVCLGLIGLIIFFQQVLYFIFKYKCSKNFIYLLPFIFTFLFDQSIQFLNPYPFMLPIMVSLLVYKEGWLIRYK